LSEVKSKQSTNSLKFVFFGKNSVGTSIIIQNFVIKERLNVFGESLNGYLCPSDANKDYFTLVEIDGEEYCSDIHISSDEENEKEILKCADLFILVYSIAQQDSYKAVEEKWTAKLKEQYPKIPRVLVGTTPDLTNVPQTSQNSLQLQLNPKTTEMGEQLAMTVKALLYVEYPCNDKAQAVTIFELFEEAIWASLRQAEKRRCKKKRFNLKSFVQKWL